MPLVRISFTPVHDANVQRDIAQQVHDALIESIGIPADDRFQLLRQSGEIVYDRTYLGIERSDAFLIVEVIFRRGRTVEQKQALYKNIADRLEVLGIRKADVMVVLQENGLEDWSFGDGVAQYVT